MMLSQNSSQQPWSFSEDCHLRSMKEAGEIWAFISGSLCKTKDNILAYWKIPQSQLYAKDTGINTDNTTKEGSIDNVTEFKVRSHR